MATPKKVLKKWVSLNKQTGAVSIDTSVANVWQDTINQVKESGRPFSIWASQAPVIKPQPIVPTISPTLQAKIDAKKTPQAPAVPKPVDQSVMDTATGMPQGIPPVTTETPAPAPITPTPVETTPAPVTTQPEAIIEPVKVEETKIETPKIETPVKQEVIEPTDAEKAAQATGVQYTMKDGIPLYNPTTKEEAVKILQMGGKLQWESKMWAVAQGNLDKVRNLGQMSDKQLSNEIVSGKVSSKELEMLTVINPELVAKAKQLSEKKTITNTTNEIQSLNNAIANGEETSTIPTSTLELLKRLQTIDADQRTPAEMKAQYQEEHPEMLEARDNINDLTTQKREIERAKRDLYDEYKAKNSGLPISMIMAGYSALSKWLDDQLYSINDNLNTEIANYNSNLDEMNMEMEWELSQQGKQEDRLWKMYGVTRAEEVRSEDIAREDARLEQAIQLEEARYERDIERQDMVSARERQYKLDDLKTEQNFNLETGLMWLGVDPKGMTPEEMKTEYANAIKAEKEAASALETSKLAKWNWSIEKINWKDMRVNKETGEVLPITKPQNSKYGFATTDNWIQVNVASTEDVPKWRRQCWAYVNDALYGGSWTGVMKDSLESKLAATGGNTTPVVWSAFVMDFWTGEQPWEDGVINGHTWVVEEVRADGIVISDMNRQWNEEFRRVFVPFDSKEYSYIKGFAVPPQSEAETQQYTDIQEVQLPEKASEYSKKSFGFGVRMSQAEKSIKNMEEKFKDSPALTEWLWGKYPNWMKTDDRQLFDQAKTNFVNAVLRQESWAVINPDEFTKADKQYFPQPWDSEAVLKQKSENRRWALLNMFNSAGNTETGESIKDIYNSIDVTNSY